MSSFETDDGTRVEAASQQSQVDVDRSASVCRGSFSYVSPEGRIVSRKWTADKNGFKTTAM